MRKYRKLGNFEEVCLVNGSFKLKRREEEKRKKKCKISVPRYTIVWFSIA